MRTTTRPTTARCTLAKYIGFLISEPKSSTCTRLAEVTDFSHDSANRFLKRENYQPKDMYDEAVKSLNPIGGTLSVDDSVLDKPYSYSVALVGHFWSGKHHRVVKGVNLITLYYTDVSGRHMPVNYRIYDKSEDKTKNDYFREMLIEVLVWGLKPAFVTGDSWYSCTTNLKTIKNHQTGFMFAVEKNRTVSLEKGKWQQVQHLDIPDNGLDVWLKDFGKIRLFRTMLKDQRRHYVVYLPEEVPFERNDFKQIHDQHWQIEQFHRAIKQVCHIEHFQVRSERPVRNHIFAAILAFVYLQKMQIEQEFTNIYQHQRGLFKETIGAFIESFAKGKDHLLPKFIGVINA
ncbi:transposase [Endozoicomonas sp. SCSIO W0465]|uniref:IS701 family transposase n=2 Tax=Endozoicomonas sp. SCSIO W0465 TaxID=2918516 RepID=UPI00207646FE|nr:transposase [Endozoicomonas sp. SCSIO W0465]USE39559.1 transposase [Endozoicomonas sp. SCSIO W0465]USE39563.1 transposase [Endozoicomonas sp. SCSIO W0465]USE39564.1 transposase [Endozoicomonas sp. SCSIO W0465]USE39568.1 transposase [Endozoicomonas sp. SCSIO W0465]USE39576.1 transposase [Endozoicomonas sp. SCSIO W0465]